MLARVTVGQSEVMRGGDIMDGLVFRPMFDVGCWNEGSMYLVGEGLKGKAWCVDNV